MKDTRLRQEQLAVKLRASGLLRGGRSKRRRRSVCEEGEKEWRTSSRFLPSKIWRPRLVIYSRVWRRGYSGRTKQVTLNCDLIELLRSKRVDGRAGRPSRRHSVLSKCQDVFYQLREVCRDGDVRKMVCGTGESPESIASGAPAPRLGVCKPAAAARQSRLRAKVALRSSIARVQAATDRLKRYVRVAGRLPVEGPLFGAVITWMPAWRPRPDAPAPPLVRPQSRARGLLRHQWVSDIAWQAGAARDFDGVRPGIYHRGEAEASAVASVCQPCSLSAVDHVRDSTQVCGAALLWALPARSCLTADPGPVALWSLPLPGVAAIEQ